MASAKTRQRLAQEPWRKTYNTKRWKDARRRALIRVGRICQNCGNTRSLDVHHITPLKHGGAPYDPDNLEVLCRPCHAATDRQFFQPAAVHPRPADFSLPETQKSAEKPAEKFEAPHEYWLSPDGRRWSRDWGGGMYVVHGEPVPVGWNADANPKAGSCIPLV